MSETELEIEKLHARIAAVKAQRDEARAHVSALETALAERTREGDEALTVRSHVIQNAGCEAQEKRTQKSIVFGILRALDLPLRDWEAEGAVTGLVSDLRARLAASGEREARWISVEERLPEPCEESRAVSAPASNVVLIAKADGTVETAWVDYFDDPEWQGYDASDWCEITHWMPLPAAPEVTNHE